MRRSGVGVRHAEFVMKQFTIPEMRETESDWWGSVQNLKNRIGQPMLVGLLGPRGRGKTAMAAMIAGAVCWKNQSCVYTTSMEMLCDIRDGFGDNDSHARIRKYQRPRLLIIDEHHRSDNVGKMDEWSMRTIERIVDKRYSNNLDTIIVSNATPDQFNDHIGESIRNRMKEIGCVLIVNGEDYRDRESQ